MSIVNVVSSSTMNIRVDAIVDATLDLTLDATIDIKS